jgi:hypothetical protein
MALCNWRVGSCMRLSIARRNVHLLGDPRALPVPARAQSPLRTVISISERMPAIGKQFYEAGPATGIARLSRYLEDQVAGGFLAIADIEVAAAQFLDSCQSTMFKPLIFNFGGPPTDERINHVVGIAVRTFLLAYAPR